MDDTDHALFPRFSAELVSSALKDTPVVMVTGLRQCGKTTLVRDFVASNTMDDDTVLAAARRDPTGLVRALDRTTIDEVQRVPDFLRAIKKSVDDDRRAGRFLLTAQPIFSQLFLVRKVEPWVQNQLKWLVKTPKLHFLDSGLLGALLGATAERIAKDRSSFGPLLEICVFSEVLKQASWFGESCALSHYRDKEQDEV